MTTFQNRAATAVRALSAALTLALCGCVDLGVPELGPDGGIQGGTGATLLSPAAAAGPLPQVTTVRLRVTDVNGVRGATLSCGQEVLAAWVLTGAEPEVELERRVDLGPCRPQGSAGGVAEVGLALLTEDGTGVRQVHGPFPLQVQFVAPDAEGSPPRLSLEHAARVGAGQPLTVRVRANDALVGPPEVTVDGVPVPVAVDSAAGAEAPVGGAWVAELPGGVAMEAAGAPSTDLFANERSVQVRATARGASGVTGQSASAVIVTRRIWQRPIPGALWVDVDGRTAPTAAKRAAHPYATDGGIWLPVQRNDRPSTWVPTFVDSRTGDLQTLPDAVTARANWMAVGLDTRGRTAMVRVNAQGVPDLAERRTLGAPLAGAESVAVTDFTGLTRAGDTLCVERVSGSGTCLGASTLRLDCLAEDGGVVTTASGPGAPGQLVTGSSAVGLAGGLLAFDYLDSSVCCPQCGNSVAFGAPGRYRMAVGLKSDAGVETFDRVMTDGQGNFSVVVAANANPTSNVPWGRFFAVGRVAFLSADGGVRSAPTAAPGVVGLDLAQVLGAMPGDIVVTVHAGTETTRVEARQAGNPTALWSNPLPGAFIPYSRRADGGAVEDTAELSFFYADASGLALMQRPGVANEVWVMSFGPALTPRWAYRHEVLTTQARLYPAPDGRTVYLVDSANSLVVALSR